MNWSTSEIEEALHSIRVEPSDDLVVPFGCTGNGGVGASSPLNYNKQLNDVDRYEPE